MMIREIPVFLPKGKNFRVLLKMSKHGCYTPIVITVDLKVEAISGRKIVHTFNLLVFRQFLFPGFL